MFLSKYFSLVLYGEYVKKIFIIDHEELQFDKNVGWTLLGINNEPNGLMSDHDYFFINEDLFNTVQSTHQKNNILLKIISNEPKKKNLSVMQHISVMKISARRRGLLAIIHSIIIFRERGRKIHYTTEKIN